MVPSGCSKICRKGFEMVVSVRLELESIAERARERSEMESERF
jgi:hypothetical protein